MLYCLTWVPSSLPLSGTFMKVHIIALTISSLPDLLFSERVSESRWGNPGLLCNRIISKCLWLKDRLWYLTLFTVGHIYHLYLWHDTPSPTTHIESPQFMMLHTIFQGFWWPQVHDEVGTETGTGDICESATLEAILCCGFSECHFNDNQYTIIKITMAHSYIVFYIKYFNEQFLIYSSK